MQKSPEYFGSKFHLKVSGMNVQNRNSIGYHQQMIRCHSSSLFVIIALIIESWSHSLIRTSHGTLWLWHNSSNLFRVIRIIITCRDNLSSEEACYRHTTATDQWKMIICAASWITCHSVCVHEKSTARNAVCTERLKNLGSGEILRNGQSEIAFICLRTGISYGVFAHWRMVCCIISAKTCPVSPSHTHLPLHTAGSQRTAKSAIKRVSNILCLAISCCGHILFLYMRATRTE